MRAVSKAILFILGACLILSVAAYAEESSLAGSSGSLNVYSKIGSVKIYLDNDPIGSTPLELDKIKVGTHLLSGAMNDENVYEQVITIKEGEITTILISESNKKKEPETRTNEPADSASFHEYGSSGGRGISFQSLYGKLGYMSSYVYSYNPSIYTTYYSSSLYYGAGYKLSLGDYVGILLEISRADLSSPDASWYIMPMTINFQMGYPIARGFSGLYYYSLGIGYYNTNLEYSGTNLSSFGYNLASGFEFPAGDLGSAFIETNYSVAENSKAEFTLYSLMLTFGYRMDI